MESGLKHKSAKSIFIIGASPPPYYGVSLATEITVRGLKRRGMEIIHINTRDKRDIKNIGNFDFVNVYLAFHHSFELLENLIKYNCDLIYLPISQGVWGFLRDSLFVLIGKLFKKKIVIHLRGGNFKNFYTESNAIFRFIIKVTLNFVDTGIVQGHCLIYHLENFFSHKKIKVLPNGLNPVPFQGSNTIKKDGIVRILFLSNLLKSKGFIELLRAVPDVLNKHTNVNFIFVGEWESKESKTESMTVIKKLKIDNYVKFLGPLFGKKKLNILKTSDIFVFPPNSPEGHPWVILEAMASGLPIITTDQGCIAEVVQDGETGFIIEKQNPGKIADKINTLIENPELREKMGNNSRKRLLKYYTEDIYIDNLEKILLQV